MGHNAMANGIRIKRPKMGHNAMANGIRIKRTN
jgi:hypothetical protein